MIVIAVKDYYLNINGKGKIKELTKDKEYTIISINQPHQKGVCIINDLGIFKIYYKKNMFIKKSNWLTKIREQKINQLLDGI
jgi:hypothetical protein